MVFVQDPPEASEGVLGEGAGTTSSLKSGVAAGIGTAINTVAPIHGLRWRP
jgi:hypothetical protein